LNRRTERRERIFSRYAVGTLIGSPHEMHLTVCPASFAGTLMFAQHAKQTTLIGGPAGAALGCFVAGAPGFPFGFDAGFGGASSTTSITS
jgi:hypothetical protein